jgi:hypothetical protein
MLSHQLLSIEENFSPYISPAKGREKMKPKKRLEAGNDWKPKTS